MGDHQIYVIGVSGEELPIGHIDDHITECSTIIAAASVLGRIQELYETDYPLKQWVLITPVSRCLDIISETINSDSVMVLTSGDPLFYGLGNTLKNRFPDKQLVFLPALSSLQLCFARFGEVWNDTAFLSLHGRSFADLNSELHRNKLFILTDRDNSPDKIARHLLEILSPSEQERYLMHVGVRLGTKKEQLYSGSLLDISDRSFKQPNCTILLRRQNPSVAANIFGLQESEIRHSRGLITKNEVRAAVLHALRLPPKGVFWDIGAGSGSISLEAGLLNPGLAVYAIEQKQDQIDNITHNRTAFKCWNMTICEGKAPQALESLPRPDSIFIGGSGGSLGAILSYIDETYPQTRRIVLTGVIKITIDTAPKLLHRLGYSVDVSIVSTTRYSYPGHDSIQFNPIHIIRATR